MPAAPTPIAPKEAGPPFAADARPVRDPTPDASQHAVAFRLSAGAGAASGLGPRLTPMMHVGLEVGSTSARLFAPSARATFQRSPTQTAGVGLSAAEFTATGGRLEVCPLRLSAARVSATACALGELDSLYARGSQIEPAREGAALSVAVGTSVMARWDVTRLVFVDAAAGLRTNLTSHRFFVRPDTTVYELPSVGGMVQGGLGVRFL